MATVRHPHLPDTRGVKLAPLLRAADHDLGAASIEVAVMQSRLHVVRLAVRAARAELARAQRLVTAPGGGHAGR